MIGDTIIDGGEEYEVIWSGGEGLIPERLTKPSGFWSPPKRLYNKKSDYWTTPRGGEPVDKVDGTPDDPGSTLESVGLPTKDSDDA